MPGVKVEVNQASAKRALAKMRQIGKDVPNFTIPHKRIGVFLQKWVFNNFKTEGGNLSDGRWEPFASGGRRVGGTIDTSAKLLQDTGALRNSFLPFFNKKTAGVGSKIKYAKVHEQGDPSTNLPQRRMLPKSKEIVKDVDRIYDEWLGKTLRKRP